MGCEKLAGSASLAIKKTLLLPFTELVFFDSLPLPSISKSSAVVCYYHNDFLQPSILLFSYIFTLEVWYFLSAIRWLYCLFFPV